MIGKGFVVEVNETSCVWESCVDWLGLSAWLVKVGDCVGATH